MKKVIPQAVAQRRVFDTVRGTLLDVTERDRRFVVREHASSRTIVCSYPKEMDQDIRNHTGQAVDVTGEASFRAGHVNRIRLTTPLRPVRREPLELSSLLGSAPGFRPARILDDEPRGGTFE